MYLTILKIVLPYAQKIAAQQITDYLNRRREQIKEVVEKLNVVSEDCPPCPPCPSGADTVSNYNLFSTTNTIFFALSGLLLGTSLTAIVYIFWNDASSKE